MNVLLAPYHQPPPAAVEVVTGGGDVACQQDEEDKVMCEFVSSSSTYLFVSLQSFNLSVNLITYRVLLTC